jgi:type IV pilus assembly protein PilN
MIKINLLTVEKARAKKKFVLPAIGGQKLTMACAAILVAVAALIGWRFWTLRSDSARVDAEIAAAQQETQRLHSIIQQVQQFEQRRAQLQQRVALIEQLRKEQTGPVHMLDQISRALPPMLWLTSLRQGGGGEVLIEGRVTTLTGLSDFVVNLENTGYFKKSVEIVNSTAESINAPPGELIEFTVRAQFHQPGTPEPKAAPARGRGAARGRGGRS